MSIASSSWRSAQDRGKGAPVDPFSAAALASEVVDILATLGAPIAGWLKSWRMKRKVRKVVKRASASFVDEHPETAEALAGSAEAIAHELARLTESGRPLTARTLAEQWAASGHLDQAEADRYATEYVQRLHDELMKIDSFRAVLSAGADVSSAETLQIINEALQETKEATRAQEEREVAASYYDAAKQYFYGALALLDGDATGAMGFAYDAQSLLDEAELNRDSLVIGSSRDLRLRFEELVEGRYEDVEAACAEGDRAKSDWAVRALSEGCAEFRALVKQRLGGLSG